MSKSRGAVRRQVILGVVPVLLAWALRLYRLEAQSFWYDEGYCAFVAALSPAEIWRWTAREFTPPLYHLALASWLPLAGWTEFAARFLSAWAGTLVVAGMMRLGDDLGPRPTGLLAALLASLSPFYLWHSQDARMYMLQALFGLLGTLLLIRALRKPARRGLWIGVAVLDALTLYAHTTGGFLLLFHALVIIVASVRSPARLARWKWGGLALGGAVLAWLPWLIYALPFLGENAGYWPGRLNWRFVVSGAFRGFVTGEMIEGAAETTTLWVWGVACLVGVVGGFLPRPDSPGAALFCRRQRWANWQPVLFLLFYLAVPVAAMAWLFRDVPKFSPRYLIVASPSVFLLPAVGLTALLSRRVGWRGAGGLILGALLITSGLGICNWYFDPACAKSDFRTAAQVVREQMTDDEIVLLVPGHTFPVWQFYFGPQGWIALPNDPILDVRHVLHYRNVVGPLNAGLEGRSGVWLVEWEPWVVDPTDLVPALLEQIGEEVAVEQPVGMRLLHYRLPADRPPLPPEPAVSPPLAAAVDLPLNLVGCVLPTGVPGDAQVHVGCYWQAEDELPLHLNVSARLMDGADVEWGRGDTAISGPRLVAGRWPVGEPVWGSYTLRPAAGIPPGDFYRVELLIYEPDGTDHGMVATGPLTIGRPSRPFTVTLPLSQVEPALLGGLMLEAADVRPGRVLPGEEVQVIAVWRVSGSFRQPHLAVEGSDDVVSLLPRPGATRSWRVGDRYRTVTRVPLSPYSLGGPTTVWAVSEDGEIPLGTVHVGVTRTFVLPPGITPLDYRLGAAISLAGVQFSVERAATGGRVNVVLYWRAGAFVEQPYTVFVHLVGPDGEIYAQADAQPRAGRHPTTHWLPGEVVADPYRLEMPADAPPGEYRVLAGLYDLTTLTRLSVTGADGEPVPDDAIPIGSFEEP